MSQANKIQWVDNLKVLGIIMVVLGHIESPLTTFIFSWHMPLFFMISGFFIKSEDSFKEYAVANFKRLMVPYFIFAFIGLVAEIIKRIALGREQINLTLALKAILFNMNMESLANQYGFVLWFLPALFFSRIIVYALIRYFKSALLQFLLVFVCFISSFYLKLPFGLSNALNAAVFIFSGYYLFKYFVNSNWRYFSLLILATIYTFVGIPRLDMSYIHYSLPIINIIWAISIVIVWIIVFQNIRIPSRFTSIFEMWSNTLFIFIIHPYTNNIAFIIEHKIRIVCWVVQLAISLLLIHILLKIKLRYQGRGIFKYV